MAIIMKWRNGDLRYGGVAHGEASIAALAWRCDHESVAAAIMAMA